MFYRLIIVSRDSLGTVRYIAEHLEVPDFDPFCLIYGLVFVVSIYSY